MNQANPFEAPVAQVDPAVADRGPAPVILCKAFKFGDHKPTKNVLVSGPVILSGEGLIMVPQSKQTATAQALSAQFGLLGVIIALFMRSTKKMEWPAETIEPYAVEHILSRTPKLPKLAPDQQVLHFKRDDITGYRSSFWKGLRIHCRTVTILPMGSRKKMAKLLQAIGLRDLDEA